MTDADAVEFDEFVARHWGEESVYRMEDERKEKAKAAETLKAKVSAELKERSKKTATKKVATKTTKKPRKPKLAEEG